VSHRLLPRVDLAVLEELPLAALQALCEHVASLVHGGAVSTVGSVGAGSSVTGKPSAVHFANPPSRGRTRVIPLRVS
jgi:hypothetical protein